MVLVTLCQDQATAVAMPTAMEKSVDSSLALPLVFPALSGVPGAFLPLGLALLLGRALIAPAG